LGTTLTTLGEREAGTTRLEEAVKAYHAALTEWTRERVPLYWAKVQTNLGAALATLGIRKKDATLLCEAVEKQLMALEVSAIGDSDGATIAANNAKRMITALKNGFALSIYETCVAKHLEALRRIPDTPHQPPIVSEPNVPPVMNFGSKIITGIKIRGDRKPPDKTEVTIKNTGRSDVVEALIRLPWQTEYTHVTAPIVGTEIVLPITLALPIFAEADRSTVKSLTNRLLQYLCQLRKAEGGLRGMNTTQAGDLVENLA
jgi:hypothetical protein